MLITVLRNDSDGYMLIYKEVVVSGQICNLAGKLKNLRLKTPATL